MMAMGGGRAWHLSAEEADLSMALGVFAEQRADAELEMVRVAGARCGGDSGGGVLSPVL